MIKNILWLDDMRDPTEYFKPTPARLKSGAFQRNTEYYNNNVFSNGRPNFIWVKTFEEFTNYILRNGLPDMISFDHDLGKGLKKGADCANWLLQYCKQTDQQLPKCFTHSANPNGRKEINSLLNLNENTIKINECELRKIIKEEIIKYYAKTI